MNRLKITTALSLGMLAAFGIALLVACAAWLGLHGLNGGIDDLTSKALPNVELLSRYQLAQAQIGRQVTALNLRRLGADMRSESWAIVEASKKEEAEARRAWEAIPSFPETEAAWKAMTAKAEAWEREIDASADLLRERDQLLRSGGDEARIKQLEDQAWTAFISARGAAKELRDLQAKVAEAQRKEADAQIQAARDAGRRATYLLLVGLVLAAAALWGLRAVLTRNIGAVFSTVRENLDAIAAGRMPEEITETRGADFNAIRDSLNRTTEAIRTLVSELGRVSSAHEKGEIDAALDPAHFEGDYRAVAQGVNEMVSGHVNIILRAIGVFGKFGEGNFDADIEKLPGKKRVLNDAIDQVRANLKGLIAELNRMSAEHEKGDIDVVIDTARFQGHFRAMAEGINAMVAAHIGAKKQAMGVFTEFGKGNFAATMPLLPGKKRFVNEAIEQVRGNLRSLVEDAGALSAAAVAGRLDVRADAARQPGDFGRIVQGINATLDAIVAPIRELAVTLEKLAAGDLSARTDPGRYQNEARRLLEGVNNTLGALLAPVNEATGVLEQLAARDLRARVTGKYPGDHARLANALNGTAGALEEALGQVASAVEQVSSAATQIASSSQAVAAGASEQAASLEETGASLESASSMARQTADSAQQASALARNARAAAGEGTSAVEGLQGSMGRIKHSAESTGQIIKDVSDIAFQTNLLALNAAVEAARAGEAGRGFAVVAEEVRSLALRAKEAAQKTEELIRQSVKEAGEGEAAATRVAAKLGEIASEVSKVTDVVAEIAAAAKEQTTAITQVNSAVTEMDKVTQQNAASAEESSSAASELSGQGEELAAMVGSFRISRAGAAVRGPARLAAPPAARAAPAVQRNGKTAGASAFPMDDAEVGREF